MPPTFDACTTTHQKRRFVLREHRSVVRFENPNTNMVKLTIVDDCAITTGPRCDFLVNIDKIDKSVLVELKGSDVKRAIEQLSASQEQLSGHLKTMIVWIVSSTRCPLASTEVQTLALKIRKRMNAILLVRNTPVDYLL
jgi:hypothetical protein